MKGETKPYYQALVDSRDFPYIVGGATKWCDSMTYPLILSLSLSCFMKRTSPDAIAFVADRKDASLYSIPGEPLCVVASFVPRLHSPALLHSV